MKHYRFFALLGLFPSVMLIPVILGLCCARVPGAAMSEKSAPAFFADSETPTLISVLDVQSGEIRQTDMEEYLVGVLAGEMPASYEIEALKAQAVAARSYIMSRMYSQSPTHPEAAVCNDPQHCKAWLSEEAATEKWAEEYRDFYLEKLRKAVSSTRGEYMVYEGEVIEAFFFAGSGGRTESSEDVWGGSRPYLKSVPSEGDIYAPNLHSEASFTVSEFWDTLSAFNSSVVPNIGTPIIGEVTRTEGGSVARISLGGQNFKGSEIRNLFGLKSANFTLKADGNNVIFSVTGNGHGVGMSQYGANYMAKSGKKYTEILTHYYTNIQIVTK